MASDPFNVWDSQTFDTTGLTVVAGETVRLASSAEILNGPTARSSIRVDIKYEAVNPAVVPFPFSLGALIEQKDDLGNWQPIAYQFSPYRGQAPERIMVLQPDISDFNAGIDDIVFPVDEELARISRQQGFLGENPFRVCILLNDPDPTGPNGFQSVTLSVTGERYDPA